MSSARTETTSTALSLKSLTTSVSRRAVLLGGGAGALSLALGGGRVHAVPGGEPGSFAMLMDLHIDDERPARTADFERIMAHIEARNPGFVLNCGDITELGLAREYEAYLAAIPESLREAMMEVPGNHEQQWSVNYDLYEQYLGEGTYSFDAGGLHFIGLDPQAMMEWGWFYDDDVLDWLERDLRSVPEATPIILFQHYAMGADWNYVHNDDEVLRIIEGYPVRGIFVGHSHLTEVSRYNGDPGHRELPQERAVLLLGGAHGHRLRAGTGDHRGDRPRRWGSRRGTTRDRAPGRSGPRWRPGPLPDARQPRGFGGGDAGGRAPACRRAGGSGPGAPLRLRAGPGAVGEPGPHRAGRGAALGRAGRRRRTVARTAQDGGAGRGRRRCRLRRRGAL
ncbi:metallophosphoesterase family protein [Sanguibacter sp. Z1732]|uniref:metallophosphoesterase family protein n=1 Tax=Sanguibacter sp. Z1732 TaxID=3435412 RepID=UPI003D9C8B85